jgi:hypothetical protein
VCNVDLATKNDMMKNDLESDKAGCSMIKGSLTSGISNILAVVPVWGFSTHVAALLTIFPSFSSQNEECSHYHY